MAERRGVEVGTRLLVRMAALPWNSGAGLRSPELAAAVDRLAMDEQDDPVDTVAIGRLADQAIARERSHLLGQISSPSFERAVAITQPDLVKPLRAYARRLAGSGVNSPPMPVKARHRRLESTLVSLLLRGVGRPTPDGAWSGVLVAEVDAGRDAEGGAAWVVEAAPDHERLHVQVDIGVVGEVFRVVTGGDLPVAHPDCWAWLADAVAALPEPTRSRWQAATEHMRRRCLDLGEELAVTGADQWVALHHEVAEIVDGLRADAGLAPVGNRRVIRVDWRLPLHGRVPPSVGDVAAASIDAWIRAQASWGFGALWAQATADSVFEAIDTDTQDRLDAVAPADSGGSTTPATLLARIGGPDHVSRASELTRRFERTIESSPAAWQAAAVSCNEGSDAAERTGRMGPWGSALLTPERRGFSVRSVRGEPALFQARWATIAPEVVDDAIRALAASASAPRSCLFTRHVNPSAALGATLAPKLAAGPVRLCRMGDGHVGVAVQAASDATDDHVLSATEIVVPVCDTAAAPELGGTDELRLFRAASTWGWELVASGLPFFPAEIRTGGHLPALRGAADITVHPERWIIPVAELVACADGATPLNRFIAWRQMVKRRRLPDVLLVRRSPSPNAVHQLVFADSVLSVEAFVRAAPTVAGVAIAVEGPNADNLMPGPDGAAHVVEVAVTFLDHDFTTPT